MFPYEGNDVAEAVKNHQNANDRQESMREVVEPASRIPSAQTGEGYNCQCQQAVLDDELRPCWDERDKEQDDCCK